MKAKQIGKRVSKDLFVKRFHLGKYRFSLVQSSLFLFGVGLVTYIAVAFLIPYIIAYNDTIKTWVFDSAHAGDYTVSDGSLVVIDDTGARPADGVNKFTNPSFTDNNNGWSVSAVPPEGWIEVPSNVLYADPLTYDPEHPSKSNFLVMKYEAKAWDTEADPPAVVETGGTVSGWAGGNDQTRYVAVSIPEGNPWRYIAQNHSTEFDAIEACNALGTEYHLITNDEWMTIARDVELQSVNWADGVVGSLVSASGGLYRGNVGNNDSVGYDGADPEGGTGRDTKAELALSNGQTVWDLSGNVWEWTSDTIMGADKPHNNTGAWVEWTVFVPPGASTYGTLSYDLTRPSVSTYNSTHGVGLYYQGANTGGPYGFLRGGTWDSTTYAGVFALHLARTPGNRYDFVGFRCASDIVAIFQSYSSSSGRGGTGGNSVTVGTVADGKIVQSVNVGSADSFNFSAYVYNLNPDKGVVDASVAQLYYGGNTITDAEYTPQGETGWYKLTGTVTGVASPVDTGVLVKAGKNVKVDDFTISVVGEYSAYTTNAYYNAQAQKWDSFSETVSASGDAFVVYQLCTDDGSACETGNAWQYWTGSAWSSASNTTTHVNTADELDLDAMSALSVTNQKVSVKAIFGFDGENMPALSEVSVGLTTDIDPPTVNASDIVMKKHVGSGSDMELDDWTNGSAPYFSWTAGEDNPGGVGLKGYCLYLGTDPDGNPATTKGLLGTSPVAIEGTTCQFIVDESSLAIDFANEALRGEPWLSSSTSSYYFNIKAIDFAGNTFPTSESFYFRFDNTLPGNPTGLSAPQGYHREIESFSIYWATSGPASATDAHSLVQGYQYRIGSDGTWYGALHTGTQDCDDLLTGGSYTLDPLFDSLATGENIFYLRTWDNACNVTASYVTATLKYNADAPSAPQNLTVDGTPKTENSFAFEWDTPAAYTGNESAITYCYTVNTVPSSTMCAWTSAKSLPAGPYATQPGENTFYVIAKDEAGNTSYTDFASVAFVANTTAPGIPRNIDIADVSTKATENWKLAVSWDVPESVGAGVDAYRIYRSSVANASCATGFGDFTQIATTGGTSYVDAGLSQQMYYYCTRACDSANNCGAVSSTVSGYPTGKYTSPAILVSDPGVTSVSTTRATINWVTDRVSDSKVRYGLGSGEYFDDEVGRSQQVTSHTIVLNNLKPGTAYYLRATWTDEDGNTGMSSEYSFRTAPPPTVKEVVATNISISSAIIRFTSSAAVGAKVYYGRDSSFGGMKEIAISPVETTYTVQLTGLDDGTKYYYRVNLIDSDGAEYSGDIYSFTTPPKPLVTNVDIEEMYGTAQPTVKVSWDSNTEVSSIVSYWPDNDPQNSREQVDLELISGRHEMEIVGLYADTRYTLVVRGVDRMGNEAVSDSNSFTTATDTRPPVISRLAIEPTISKSAPAEYAAQLIVSWETDEPATSQVEIGEGTGTTYTKMTQRSEDLSYQHVVIVSDLSPSKVYHLRAISVDKAGNEAKSRDQVTITAKRSESALDLVLRELMNIFGISQ